VSVRANQLGANDGGCKIIGQKARSPDRTVTRSREGPVGAGTLRWQSGPWQPVMGVSGGGPIGWSTSAWPVCPPAMAT
jgi:hypothetical protein